MQATWPPPPWLQNTDVLSCLVTPIFPQPARTSRLARASKCDIVFTHQLISLLERRSPLYSRLRLMKYFSACDWILLAPTSALAKTSTTYMISGKSKHSALSQISDFTHLTHRFPPTLRYLLSH